MRTLRIGDFVDSVVADIEDAGLTEVIIVGHSMAGVTVPGVVTKLGAARVREMVLAGACVPHEGAAAADVILWPSAAFARRHAKRSAPMVFPPGVPRFAMLNGVPSSRRRFLSGRLYPDAPHIPVEPVSRIGMPDDVPRTWILTTRDRTHSTREQRASIKALGGVQTVIEMDTCHDLMVSEPERLAEILVGRCRHYG